MNREEFNNIKEKLYDLQVPVDSGVWDGISGSLRRRKRARLFYWASSVAAVIIAALFIFVPSLEEDEFLVAVAQVENDTDEQIQRSAEVVEYRTNKVANVPGASVVAVLEVENPVQERTADDNENENENMNVVSAKEEKSDDAGNLYTDEFEQYIAQAEVKKGRKYTVALSSGVIPGSTASVSGSIIKASSAGAGSLTQSHMIEQVSDTRYSLPLNLGIQLQFALKPNMALGVGVNYTMLRSSYDCLINKKSFNIKQTLHYIGIPVNVYGLVVDKNNFSFYVNAGGTLEKGIRAMYHLKSYDTSEHSSASIDGVQFSINGGLGVEYRLNNTLGLYFEPNIVYYFNSDIPRSIRTDQPLQVKAELGFRFRF